MFGSEEDITAWQKQADIQATSDADALKNISMKTRFETQYQIQRKWISDEKQAQIEYVRLILSGIDFWEQKLLGLYIRTPTWPSQVSTHRFPNDILASFAR